MTQYDNEIDDGAGYLGYAEAFARVTDTVPRLGPEELPLDRAAGRIAAEDVVARISYPSQDVSLKDGYAVISGDIETASPEQAVTLEVIGEAFAASAFRGSVGPGRAVKITSGAPIPSGATAVVSDEFCESTTSDRVTVIADAGPGRNVLQAGAEVRADATIVERGGRLLPGYLGLAAAAGIHAVSVYRRPRVAVIGVGDEVVAPGENLSPGQLYASNLVTMEAWLASFDITCASSVVPDDRTAIQRELERHIGEADAVLTSGGAWGSERDLVVGALGGLGWEQVFHHVRMGPGKGIAYGRWREKPVFCLPGGPASNEMAFLQLALPGILRMSGDTRHPLQTVAARLTEDVPARHRAWTEFKDATLERGENGDYTVSLYRHRSRLQAIASAHGLVCVPEGTDGLRAGEAVAVQVLSPRLDDL